MKMFFDKPTSPIEPGKFFKGLGCASVPISQFCPNSTTTFIQTDISPSSGSRARRLDEIRVSLQGLDTICRMQVWVDGRPYFLGTIGASRKLLNIWTQPGSLIAWYIALINLSATKDYTLDFSFDISEFEAEIMRPSPGIANPAIGTLTWW